ncbi:YbhB/YbcL family Raf kinase inhibitor-like protein [Anaeromicropila herbilytica]|uniref:Phosphatidylethanolamine-binding protein n=1 Tax=Anaeromicropila herbilytica TaxID=2785025 RepID=A0A7R7ELF7_9FIRM|nr:phosphatidylethanolamine-binding protein [Anaeromicropila herbilytica]BCN30969.1 hypothetical protein bsdtb5_22640 [Anaeromicropila herbilytica]
MKKQILYLLICVLLAVTLAACNKSKNSKETTKDSTKESTNESSEDVIEDEEIKITSTSLKDDGRWLSVITSSKGENLSPQLSWTPVDKASCYAIYMIDTSAGNWCHWIAKDVKVTELEQGAKLDNSQYIGPYPPSGTHTYEVRIFALKATPDSYKGINNSENYKLDSIISALDTSNGETGNILATGVISGTYKSSDIVE